MRVLKMVTLLVSILMVLLQCSRQESITNLAGQRKLVSAWEPMMYTFIAVGSEVMEDTLMIYPDSIRWIYDIPAGGPSSLSVTLSGQIMGSTSYAPDLVASLKADSWLDSAINAIIKDNTLSAAIQDSLIRDAAMVADNNINSIKAVKNSEILTNTHLEVETYINGTITAVPLACDANGVFSGTVQIASSPLPEVILTENTRLFVKNGGQVLDIITLDNPW
jgi:hypothetical protein